MSESPFSRRKGRKPRAPEDQRRHNLTVRVRGRTREVLDREATRNRRSLSEEIETRLEHSLSEITTIERLFGGPAAVAFLTVLGSAIRLALLHARSRNLNEERTRRLVRAAVDRITATHLWTEGDESKAPLGEITHMKHGQVIPRPPEPPEAAGDSLALDLMSFEQDPMLDAFGELPIAKRWTVLEDYALPLPEPVTLDQTEADRSRPIKPEDEA